MSIYDYLFLYLSGYILSMILFRYGNYYFNENTEITTAAGLSLLSWVSIFIQVLYFIVIIFKVNTDKYNDWFTASKGDK